MGVMAPPAKPPVDLASLLSMDPGKGRILLGRERMFFTVQQAVDTDAAGTGAVPA